MPPAADAADAAARLSALDAFAARLADGPAALTARVSSAGPDAAAGAGELELEFTADEVRLAVDRERAALREIIDTAAAAAAAAASVAASPAVPPSAQVTARPDSASATGAGSAMRPSTAAAAAAGDPATSAAQVESLVELVSSLTGKLRIPATTDEDTVNAAGLPIHEIRETPAGETLGAAPAATEAAVEIEEDDGGAYWTDEAARRRDELRRRVFADDFEFSEDEDEEEEDAEGAVESGDGGGGEDGAGNEIFDDAVDSDAPTYALPSPGRAAASMDPALAAQTVAPAAPAALAAPPKSILKPPPARKKSVSFDASVPAPPDSPPPTTARLGGFPLAPLAGGNVPVPVLGEPRPRAVPELAGGFAGFRPGFLTRPTAGPAGVAGSTAPAGVASAPSAAGTAGQATSALPTAPPTSAPAADAGAPAGAKKKSLFAQRREAAAPALPKLSDAREMATMKLQVVEKPAAAAPMSVAKSRRAASDTAGTPEGSVAGAIGGGARGEAGRVRDEEHGMDENEGRFEDGDDDDDDDGDDDDDYEMGDLGEFSDDEEDEYMLDEAMLRREVALEYHRRQAYLPRPASDEDDEYADAGAGGGGVMLGVPRVSTITGGDGEGEAPLRIVNPTPDDLANFMRVGRAEDGELVFEPPLVGGSSDESDGEDAGAAADDRRRRREARRDVRARLLRGETGGADARAEDPALRGEMERRWQESLPPTVQGVVERPVADAVVERPVAEAVVERPAAHAVVDSDSGAPAAQQANGTDAKPKRVSRFKATRHAQ